MLRNDRKYVLFTLGMDNPYLNLAAQLCNFAYTEYDYEFFESDWGEYIWSTLGAPESTRQEVIMYLKGKCADKTCSTCKYRIDTGRELPFCVKRKKTIKQDTFCIMHRT